MTTTREQVTSTVWVCVDCYEVHHGVSEREDRGETFDREPLGLIGDDVEVTAGLLWEEHAEDCPGRIEHELGMGYVDATECDCEHQSFSWSWCQGCGSKLGGAREALTIWADETHAEDCGYCAAGEPMRHTYQPPTTD